MLPYKTRPRSLQTSLTHTEPDPAHTLPSSACNRYAFVVAIPNLIRKTARTPISIVDCLQLLLHLPVDQPDIPLLTPKLQTTDLLCTCLRFCCFVTEDYYLLLRTEYMRGTIQVHHYFPGGLLFTYYMDPKLCTTLTVVNVVTLLA